VLDKETVRKIAMKYSEDVRQLFDPKSIILFGSYVNGSPHEFSDIDIAVVFSDFDGNWLEAWTKLCHLTWDVCIDIEPHMMDDANDRSGFLDYIRKNGEIIYEAS
jgi:predicted nucleotidyltransferase